MENQQEKDMDLIDRYLSNRLETSEQQSFELRLQEPEFQEKVQLLREIKEAVEARALSRLKGVLQAEHQKLSKSPSPSKWLWLLLGIVVVGLLVALFWWANGRTTTDAIFATHFEVTPLVEGQPTRGVPLDTNDEAFRAYQEGNFEEAIAGFDRLLASNDQDDLRFFKANVLLETGRTREAIGLLEGILERSNTNYREESEWILALAYLKNRQINRAKIILGSLSQSGFYAPRATAILEQLED